MERKYETVLILKNDLSDQDRDDTVNKIIKIIEGLKGKIVNSNVWFKDRSFYYPLKSKGAEKKKYTRGCYWLIQFLSQTDSLTELKETIRLEERILRSIILKSNDKTTTK